MAYINGRGTLIALRLSDGGGGNLKEISTASEMDSILANATASEVGKFYMYVGETTDKYENGALYRVAKNETISFGVEYIVASDNTKMTEFYTADNGISWLDFSTNDDDFSEDSRAILWRNGETIKLNGKEVEPSEQIMNGVTYVAY